MTENEIKNTKEWFENFIETYALSNQETIEFQKAVACLEENQQYKAIGTIDEFKALKEKDTPKKPIIKNWCPAICPNCKQNLSESRGDGYWVHYTSLERCDCGQKLDWSE